MKNRLIESRKTQRHSCYGPIEFRVQGWHTFTGRIMNLSLDGCFIQPHQPTGHTVGDILDLRFEVNYLTFRARCIVRRVAADGSLGLEIDMLSDRTRRQLHELIGELDLDSTPLPNPLPDQPSEQ